jgi:hypothetical protein
MTRISKKCEMSCWKNQASDVNFVPEFSPSRNRDIVRVRSGAQHFALLPPERVGRNQSDDALPQSRVLGLTLAVAAGRCPHEVRRWTRRDRARQSLFRQAAIFFPTSRNL